MGKIVRGWLPDRPDIRDKWFEPEPVKDKKLKRSGVVDLREFCAPIYEQFAIGSCTAMAIAGLLEYNRNQQKLPRIVPSRLFIYYNERAREGTINEDAGAFLRSGIKVVAKLGYPDETLWPYDEAKFKRRPPAKAYNNATQHKAFEYLRLDNTKLEHLLACLDQGECFVFGSTVYDSFERADSNGGIVPMPSMKDREDGGHAMMACGYNERTKMFLIRNSWGTDLGDKGYYYMPFAYLTNEELSDDFWTIRSVS